jgi:hypothetical protein
VCFSDHQQNIEKGRKPSQIAFCCFLLPNPQGFAVQSYVTGEGPYANWSKHVAGEYFSFSRAMRLYMWHAAVA